MKAIVFIPLTQGKSASIDLLDWELVSQYKWFLHRSGRNLFYARAKIPGIKSGVLLHTLLYPPGKGYDVAHLDGNGLNCQRRNMVHKNRAQNCWGHQTLQGGTSIFRGVNKLASGKWGAYINKGGKRICLGAYFESELDAAEVRDAAAKKLYGEHAFFNLKQPERDICWAGHKVVLFGSDRCPVCAAIDRLDKELLKADARIAELEEILGANQMSNWNGGHA